MEQHLNNFVLIFVVVDPIGVAGLFAAMSASATDAQRRRMASKATLLAAAILLVFSLGGNLLLNALGITLPAFRIAGGALLFLLAIDMVFARQTGLRSATSSEQDEASHKEDISVFPLAFPLISGPGAITSTMFITAQSSGMADWIGVLAALAAVMFITYLCLRSASRILAVLGETGTNVIGRLFGVLLAALAVQFMIDGIRVALGPPSAPIL